MTSKTAEFFDAVGNFNNTTPLSDFCKRCNLVSADFHIDSSIDFTFNFNNERFSIIDHVLFPSLYLN